MTVLQAIFLSVIEGITEFLPISSTFHLLIAQDLMGIEQTEFTKLFSVFIQAGAILAVVVLFAKDLVKDYSLIGKSLASFLPTALIGFVFYDLIKGYFFETFSLTISIFIGVGILFLILEKRIAAKHIELSHSLGDLTYKHAVLIGLVQGLAILPGVSRAASVLVIMMLMKYERAEAARYSFIVSIPTIFAASAYDLLLSSDSAFSSSSSIGLLTLGFIISFLVALAVVYWLIRYLQRNTLIAFGYYRIGVGVLLLGLLIFSGI